MVRKFKKLNYKAIKYFSAHPVYNSFVHMIIGVGAGLMIIPLIPGDLNMWGAGLILLGILAHLIPFLS